MAKKAQKPRLQRIFIRAQDNDGKWGNQSLADTDTMNFIQWYGAYLFRAYKEDRNAMVNLLDDLGVPPTEISADMYDALESGDDSAK